MALLTEEEEKTPVLQTSIQPGVVGLSATSGQSSTGPAVQPLSAPSTTNNQTVGLTANTGSPATATTAPTTQGAGLLPASTGITPVETNELQPAATGTQTPYAAVAQKFEGLSRPQAPKADYAAVAEKYASVNRPAQAQAAPPPSAQKTSITSPLPTATEERTAAKTKTITPELTTDQKISNVIAEILDPNNRNQFTSKRLTNLINVASPLWNATKDAATLSMKQQGITGGAGTAYLNSLSRQTGATVNALLKELDDSAIQDLINVNKYGFDTVSKMYEFEQQQKSDTRNNFDADLTSLEDSGSTDPQAYIDLYSTYGKTLTAEQAAAMAERTGLTTQSELASLRRAVTQDYSEQEDKVQKSIPGAYFNGQQYYTLTDAERMEIDAKVGQAKTAMEGMTTAGIAKAKGILQELATKFPSVFGTAEEYANWNPWDTNLTSRTSAKADDMKSAVVLFTGNNTSSIEDALDLVTKKWVNPSNIMGQFDSIWNGMEQSDRNNTLDKIGLAEGETPNTEEEMRRFIAADMILDYKNNMTASQSDMESLLAENPELRRAIDSLPLEQREPAKTALQTMLVSQALGEYKKDENGNMVLQAQEFPLYSPESPYAMHIYDWDIGSWSAEADGAPATFNPTYAGSTLLRSDRAANITDPDTLASYSLYDKQLDDAYYTQLRGSNPIKNRLEWFKSVKPEWNADTKKVEFRKDLTTIEKPVIPDLKTAQDMFSEDPTNWDVAQAYTDKGGEAIPKFNPTTFADIPKDNATLNPAGSNGWMVLNGELVKFVNYSLKDGGELRYLDKNGNEFVYNGNTKTRGVLKFPDSERLSQVTKGTGDSYNIANIHTPAIKDFYRIGQNPSAVYNVSPQDLQKVFNLQKELKTKIQNNPDEYPRSMDGESMTVEDLAFWLAVKEVIDKPTKPIGGLLGATAGSTGLVSNTGSPQVSGGTFSPIGVS